MGAHLTGIQGRMPLYRQGLGKSGTDKAGSRNGTRPLALGGFQWTSEGEEVTDVVTVGLGEVFL